MTDTTVTAMFKTLTESLPENLQKNEDLFILAWTTTPWTLPSNTALTVGKKIDYVVVQTFNQYTHLPIRVMLAKALVNKQFSGKYTAVKHLDQMNAYQSGDKKIPYLITQEIKEKNCLKFAMNSSGNRLLYR